MYDEKIGLMRKQRIVERQRELCLRFQPGQSHRRRHARKRVRCGHGHRQRRARSQRSVLSRQHLQFDVARRQGVETREHMHRFTAEECLRQRRHPRWRCRPRDGGSRYARRTQSREHPQDAGLDILCGRDEFACAAGGIRQAMQQAFRRRTADADHEHPLVCGARFVKERIRAKYFAVRDQQHVGGTVVGFHPEHGPQCAGHFRAAHARIRLREKHPHAPDRCSIGRDQSVDIVVDFRAKA